MALVHIENLGFQIGKSALLEDVSFHLSAGEILAVCGPNGAGKSTLLKCLASQLIPTAGTIEIDGRRLNEYPPGLIAKWRAILPQSGTIPFEFTAREIVLLGRTPHTQGILTQADHIIAKKALALTDASHLSERVVSTLSGGEMQRVHLARVLAQIWEPLAAPGRLLLLDEPTSALDLKHQHLLMRTARLLASEKAAVLVILHDLQLAAQYADRILLLHEGKIAAIGSPREILTVRLLRDVFEVEAQLIESPTSSSPLISIQQPHSP
jgi:iron complex transport system ATP-binding protein